MILTTDSDDAEALRVLIDRILMGVHTTQPGIVKALKASGDLLVCDIQPAIRQKETKNGVVEDVNAALLENVPLVLPYAQNLGLSVTLPIGINDEVMVHFAERSLDVWQEFGGIQSVEEKTVPRHHDLSDAIAVPGIISKPYTIQEYSTDSIEIRNEDATVAVEVGQDSLNLRDGGGASIILPGDGTIIIIGDILHTGNQDTSGVITGGDVKTIEGVDLDTHTHDYTWTDPAGAGETDPPNTEA